MIFQESKGRIGIILFLKTNKNLIIIFILIFFRFFSFLFLELSSQSQDRLKKKVNILGKITKSAAFTTPKIQETIKNKDQWKILRRACITYPKNKQKLTKYPKNTKTNNFNWCHCSMNKIQKKKNKKRFFNWRPLVFYI